MKTFFIFSTSVIKEKEEEKVETAEGGTCVVTAPCAVLESGPAPEPGKEPALEPT